MTGNYDYPAELHRLMKHHPNPEVWKSLASVFATWPDNETRYQVDWRAVLQHLLQQSPSPELWKAICNLFLPWPEGEARTQAIVVTDQQLAHWDPILRVAFADWIPLYNKGHITELGLLIRYLRLYRMSDRATGILKAIGKSSYLQKLSHLSIHGCEDIDPEAFIVLAQSPYIHNLQSLEIHRSSLGMIDSYYKSLESMSIEQMCSQRIVPMRVYFSELMQSSVTANLSALKLTSLSLSDWYIDFLSRRPNTIQIEFFDLGNNRISSKGAEIIANNQAFQNITSLDLSSNHIRDEGAYYIARSPHLRKLQELNLLETNITQAGRQALLNAPHLRHTKIIFERSQL